MNLFPLSTIRCHESFRRICLPILLFALSLTITSSVTAQIGNHFQLSQRTIPFDTTCGTTQCRDIVLRNVSNNPISIVAVSGPGGSFSLDPSTPLAPAVTIQGRDSLRVRYCFSPTAVSAAESDRVLFTVDTGDDPNFAVDTLRFTGRARGPVVSIDPPTINFGDVTVGQQSCVMVNVRNDGDQPYNIETLNEFAFPFSPIRFPNLLIPAGTLTQVEVCFTPINPNSFRDTLTIENGGCGNIPSLIVQGRGLSVIANVGPVLQLVPPIFDTTLCGTSECRTIVIRNVGTDPLDLTGADNIPAPFAGSIRPLPVTIQPNQERTFTLCYAPTEPQVRDTAIITMVADNRVSLSIATVFDVSGSMTIRDFNGLTRIEAAHDAGVSFLGNLINDPGRGVVDEGAVYQFSDQNNIQRLAGYTSNVPTLQAAVPTTAAGGTCLYQAVVNFSNELAGQNIPGRRVMIVLADGDNSCPTSTTLQDAITAAQNAGVRVYTIGIGNANTSILTQLAGSTGGFFSEAVSPTELLQAYQQIANSLSQNQTTSFTMTGQSVAPNMEINPTSIDFDSVRVGRNRCETVTITNTGDAPLNINDLIIPSEHYSVNPTTFAPVLPNQSVSVEICFEPIRLRHLDSVFTFPFVRCVPDSKSVAVAGVGYDSVVVSITGNYTARPESMISIPVRLLNRIPDNYELDSLELTFQYNKTMLYPQPEREPLLLPNTLSAPMIDQDAERSFTQRDGLLRVMLNGGRIVNPLTDSLLTNLGLIVLHGNALVTPVDIISARFADGNPKVGIVSTAQFTADSLCFQERRLIDASARFGPAAKLLSQSQDFAVVQLTLDQEATVRTELYDPLGRFAGRVIDGVREEGTYELTIDLRNLPAGPYLLRTIIGTDYQLVTPILH